jgi:hypothetical protein
MASMKIKLVTAICVLALGVFGSTPCSATDELDMMADVVLVRPFCLLATVVGSAFFVVSLPIAAASRSVDRSARMFVVRPARATFTRPLGDIEALHDGEQD